MENYFESAFDLESLYYYIVYNDNTSGKDPQFTSQLYHYTNQETLDNYIVKPHQLELRLTKLTDFSDKEEGGHIQRVLESSFCESYHANEINQSFFSHIMCEFNSYIHKHDDRSDWYVFSFSRNGNCPYLKENYACRNKKLGAVLGIQTLGLLQTANGHKSFSEKETAEKSTDIDLPTAFLYDVIYDPAIIKARIRKIVRKAYELYSISPTNKRWLSRIMEAMVDLYKLHYKSPAYSFEEETRLIVNGKTIKGVQEFYSFSSRLLHTSSYSEHGNPDYLYLYLNKAQAQYQIWTVDPDAKWEISERAE